MATTIVDDELWDDFHRVVNMTSRELQDWLLVEAAGEVAESEPEHAGPELGNRVLQILRKRRADLTPDDVQIMEEVVDRVMSERDVDLEPTAGDAAWRRKLMDMGHDPLKPA
jgi:hypothetical protein